jgi:glycosyltransferase involved in cell wall biosynthesis
MIHICIPCRNEDRTIGVLLWKIREVMVDLGRDFQVFVLDDASSDGTGELLEKYRRVLPLTVLSERRPIGYGPAVEKLLRTAAGSTRYPKRDAIVTMQGDFTEHPEHLRALIKTFEGGADVVAGGPATEAVQPGAGARGRPGSGQSPPRAVRLARWLARIVLDKAVGGAGGGDPLQGFRVYRAIVIRKALRAAAARPLITTDGWAANAELMKVVAPFARRIANVPLGLRYDIRSRRTRVRVLPTVREILRLRRVPPLEPEGDGAA